MADRDRSQPHNLHMQPHQPSRNEGGMKQLLPRTGPSTSQILAVVTLLPITLTLLGLAGITLAGTLLGLALATPVFVICSPVLVPAAILMAGAVTAIISSGAFGVTGLSSLSYVFNSFRRGQGPVDYAMRSVQEGTMQVGEKARQMGEHIGEKTKQTGEMIKSKAQPEGKEGAGGRT